MKPIITTVLIIVLLQNACRSQTTFSNDLIKTYAIANNKHIVSLAVCRNELDQMATLSGEVDAANKPYLIFTLFDDDVAIQFQTLMMPSPGEIPAGSILVVNDLKRFSKNSECGPGYIAAGSVNSNGSPLYGILIMLDDLGTFKRCQYFPTLSECKGVQPSGDGFLTVGNSISGEGVCQARIIKTDCKLSYVWAEQVSNYSGGAECYSPYSKGSTALSKIVSMGKDVFAFAGTAWWLESPSSFGDRNIVLGSIASDGSMLWRNSYGYAGAGIRSEESLKALSVDTSDPMRPQIITLGEYIYKVTNPCAADSMPSDTSNLVIAVDYSGGVNWAKSFARKDITMAARLCLDMTCAGSQIGVYTNSKAPGWAYSVPGLLRLDRLGTFTGGRYYDHPPAYVVDQAIGASGITADYSGNFFALQLLKSGQVFALQSYPVITSSCDMFADNITLRTVIMPSINVPDTKTALTSKPVKFIMKEEKWIETVRCTKQKD